MYVCFFRHFELNWKRGLLYSLYKLLPIQTEILNLCKGGIGLCVLIIPIFEAKLCLIWILRCSKFELPFSYHMRMRNIFELFIWIFSKLVLKLLSLKTIEHRFLIMWDLFLFKNCYLCFPNWLKPYLNITMCQIWTVSCTQWLHLYGGGTRRSSPILFISEHDLRLVTILWCIKFGSNRSYRVHRRTWVDRLKLS